MSLSNVLVTGGSVNIAVGDINVGGSKIDEGIKSLYSHCAPGAFHDSAERFDPPKCHPNTREAILQEILEWVDDDSDTSTPFMWLHGPAGAGKSAIGQSIAQILQARRRASATFFFARGSITGRADAKTLVPSLAYQLAQNIPATRDFISSTVITDPGIFNRSFETQVQELLVVPLLGASGTLTTPSKHSLIIIDGLDECHNRDVQRAIVRIFAAALNSMQHNLPHKLLIASRPEVHIMAAFNHREVEKLSRRLALDDTYEPDDDIRRFLRDSFTTILEEHPLRSSLERSWPSEQDINTLVQKSSGQFIYASTVVQYVSSFKHMPDDRLRMIFVLPVERTDQPFAQLDALYSHIFAVAEHLDIILCLLRTTLMTSFPNSLSLASSFYEPEYPSLSRQSASQTAKSELYRLLSLHNISEKQLALYLGDLVSIVAFNKWTGWIRFLHASLPDYLSDMSRSGKFYINQDEVNLRRARLYALAYSNGFFFHFSVF
ncbi:hypothetical protein B0H34DRAFT_488122 [Crassisporium funariophilum]|nr:hypothetical protein B0H34DRAFT_488122 [Crassisporium funariophilum]